MRGAVAGLMLLGSPAAAWDFTETNVCTVTHAGPEMAVELTFDPARALYTIALTRPDAPWPQSPNFQLRFDGPRSLIIGTDRHQMDDQQRTLSVSDSGFGNVLDGIQFNNAMTALIGNETVSLSTDASASAMEAFRDCPSTPLS